MGKFKGYRKTKAIKQKLLPTKYKTHFIEYGLQKEEISKNEIMNNLMQQGAFIDYLNFYIKERDGVIEELNTIKDVNKLLLETIDIELNGIEYKYLFKK